MQRASICMSPSPMQASAQVVQAWAQSKQASMHSTNALVSTTTPLGFVSTICQAWVMFCLLLSVHLSSERMCLWVMLLAQLDHLPYLL
jgi:hypothetical protein